MKYLSINKAIKKVTALSLICAVTAVSCNRDLLDKKPLDAISEDAVFNDPTFLQNYVYNIYNGIKPPWSPGSGGAMKR